MKIKYLSLIASSFASITLLASGCSSEDPKPSITPAGNSGDGSVAQCSEKGQIFNHLGKCESCPTGLVVSNNKCLTAAQKEQENTCTARGATFNSDSMACTDNIGSCLRVEPVGRKVFSEVSQTCVDKIKSEQICLPQGYDPQTDKCTQTEESCRALGQGIANGVCTGTPNLTAQQQQAKAECTNRGLEYNALNNTCRASVAICQQSNQQFDANTGQCVPLSLLDRILPGIIGGLGSIFNSN